MPHATHPPSPGLQALVLCGPGLSLNTFTSTPSTLPKCLLPIANRPMVWYPLDWCHRMGIYDITLVTPADAAPPLEAVLRSHPVLTSLSGPRPEVLAPKGLEMTSGTAELLRLGEVQRVIKGDFVVLSCDFVSEVDGSRVLQQWMGLNPSLAASSSSRRKGGLAVYYPTYGREGISSKKDETDFVATVPLPKPNVMLPMGIEEVVMVMPTDTLNDTLDENKQALPIRQTLLAKHGNVKIRTKHRDAHVYFLPLWVKEFVARNEKFDSISEDVLGWWAKAGWQAGLAAKLGMDEVLAGKRSTDDEGANAGSVDEEEEVDATALSSTKSAPVAVRQSPQAFATRVRTSTAPPPRPKLAVPPLLAYMQPASPTQPLIRRIDTAPQLASISLHIARLPPSDPSPLAHEHKIHPSASIGQQTRISQEDCLIAENVTIGIRCNIKESVVGPNCEIGSNVRLTKCVLMDGVVVGDGVQMVGCIAGKRARVEGTSTTGAKGSEVEVDGAAVKGKGKGKQKATSQSGGEEDDKTKLTECEIAPFFVVEAGTEAKGETMKAFDPEGEIGGDGEEDVGDEEDAE
ncbi:Translation initiation factor eIF-2B subunit gamma [Friedmanniomyces endolithicus]|uniref:Translation initiation factor eIF2B subunit gamma n=1 Tax=Friedmanniomyces endolithicus TaxID=329885 RepID=A0AAN6K301_9PEZI|nr:Translation initiation factor eIF-2B subunit gamma [Friedmanniomyces endolithicus]KAK0797037.1 Translation initiation factor eIF-2B subunit gamma [Friedmanniomyces endolithicus]KAK0798037.1 Translation initiation factor eIF-2B subunit gamma [Friedmanniomyces endolithicus]KAK0813705.1 Translation initiation factor eIF-2B subunit gamma [Friedmanniomyces endolithicus]KAK0866042.1 Translation initiation factor eIF-2B subunit gamma [Friedmanniomyces endolithicus]